MIQMALGEIPEDEAYKILAKLIKCSGSGQVSGQMMDNQMVGNQMMGNQMMDNNDPNQPPSGLMGSMAAFGQPQQFSQSTLTPNPEALNAVKQFAASGQLKQFKGIADTFLGKDTRKKLQSFVSGQIENRLGAGGANAIAQFKQAASTKTGAPTPAPAPAPTPAPTPAPAPAAPAAQTGGRRTKKSRSKSKSRTKSKNRSRKNRRSRRN